MPLLGETYDKKGQQLSETSLKTSLPLAIHSYCLFPAFHPVTNSWKIFFPLYHYALVSFKAFGEVQCLTGFSELMHTVCQLDHFFAHAHQLLQWPLKCWVTSSFCHTCHVSIHSALPPTWLTEKPELSVSSSPFLRLFYFWKCEVPNCHVLF